MFWCTSLCVYYIRETINEDNVYWTVKPDKRFNLYLCVRDRCGYRRCGVLVGRKGIKKGLAKCTYIIFGGRLCGNR